jgi:hypothetical protein
VAQNRNAIVEQFLPTPFEWLLMMDSDMEFDHDVPERLIASANENNVKILSGMYVGRPLKDGELYPIWFGKIDPTLPENEGCDSRILSEVNHDGLTPCTGGVGMGCCLIHREVLEAMRMMYHEKEPWIWFSWDTASFRGQLVSRGEDLSFCLNAAAIGYPTYGDARIRLGHFKTAMLYYQGAPK